MRAIKPQTATIPPISRPPIAPKGITFSKRTKSVRPPAAAHRTVANLESFLSWAYAVANEGLPVLLPRSIERLA